MAQAATGWGLLEQVELSRLAVGQRAARKRKLEFGQFLTPEPVARLMASMFSFAGETLRILDPGAGIGSLSAACIAEICSRENRPAEILLTVCEIDDLLIPSLQQTMSLCERVCRRSGIGFTHKLIHGDFLEAAMQSVKGHLFGTQVLGPFDSAILNPPYKKINSHSHARKLLDKTGIPTSNLYTGFLGLAISLLRPRGEIVAITPRSFCNGTYFRDFRKFLLGELSLRRLHVFESREEAFRGDDVLQENIILHGVRSREQPERVEVRCTARLEDELFSVLEVPFTAVVQPNDRESFIRITPGKFDEFVSEAMQGLRSSLDELGIQVSTGPVVDFRSRAALRQNAGIDTVPLIYPAHFRSGSVVWPVDGPKPNALAVSNRTSALLLKNDYYVLVKRFTSKEESKRIVAALLDPRSLHCENVAFENHLNYFHENGHGLSPDIAKGLTVFLNWTLLDAYFRQFSGHTQVNATDLRNIRYPSRSQLEAIGRSIEHVFPGQEELDQILEDQLLREHMPPKKNVRIANQKIGQAQSVLKAFGLPKNVRSGLTLLALLGLKPESLWAEASNPLCGITPMMEFFAKNYGIHYAPNTRETVRRQTVHELLDAGLVLLNPDDPERPINSAKTVYQIEPSVLKLLRRFGSLDWEPKRSNFFQRWCPIEGKRYGTAKWHAFQ